MPERCTIDMVITRRGRFTTHMRYVARDPEGATIAQSEVFDGDYTGAHRHRPEQRAPLDALLERLRADRWQVVGAGAQWYQIELTRS